MQKLGLPEHRDAKLIRSSKRLGSTSLSCQSQAQTLKCAPQNELVDLSACPIHEEQAETLCLVVVGALFLLVLSPWPVQERCAPIAVFFRECPRRSKINDSGYLFVHIRPSPRNALDCAAACTARASHISARRANLWSGTASHSTYACAVTPRLGPIDVYRSSVHPGRSPLARSANRVETGHAKKMPHIATKRILYA